MGGSLESEDARERKLDSPELGRYAYLPREQSHSKKVTNDEEDSRRKLQASTTLNVEFTACTFKVSEREWIRDMVSYVMLMSTHPIGLVCAASELCLLCRSHELSQSRQSSRRWRQCNVHYNSI